MTNHETDSIETMEDLIPNNDINIPKYNKGDVVVGKISGINESHIIISLGVKQDGYAEIGDYIDKGKLPYKIGDEIKGFIVKMNDEQIVVSRSLNRSHGNKILIREAFEAHIPVKGKVVEVRKGGFNVDVFGVNAFCPTSLIDLIVNEKPETYLHNTYDFEILEYGKGNIIVSRKKILATDLSEKKEKFLSSVKVGDVIKGVVVRVAPFGAFIELGGFEGLLHISEMSWSHIDKASELLKVGDEIDVKVIVLDGEKISLSIKALSDNPLKEILKKYSVGDEVKCRVVRNEKFGSFVEIEKGLEGLIPVSLMTKRSKQNRRLKPSDILKVGDELNAHIVKIDMSSLKISLSSQNTLPDSWLTEVVDYSEGQELTGTLESISEFGLFVKITDNLTGLVPQSKLKVAKLEVSKDDIGTDIQVRITKINTEDFRISLEPSSLPVWERSEDRKERREHREPRKDKGERGDKRREGGKPDSTRSRYSHDYKNQSHDKEQTGDSDWAKYATNYQSVPEDNPFNIL